MGWADAPMVKKSAWESAPVVNAKPDASSVPMEAEREGILAGGPVKAGAKLIQGAVSGVADLGETILKHSPFLRNNEWNKERSESLQEYNQENDGALFNTGRLAGNVAATYPVGGVLAAPIKGVKALAPLATAIETGGFRTGLTPTTLAGKVGNQGLRALGGGITGAGAAASLNPQDAVAGGLIGGLAPGVLGAVGAGASGISRLARGGDKGAGLAKALDLATPEQREAVAKLLRSGETLVPGASPTVAQILQTPQSSILNRVVYKSAGGGALQSKVEQQIAARLAALEKVAPTDPNGFASAQADFGNTIESRIIPEEAELRRLNSELFQNIDPAQASRFTLPLDDMRYAIDTYLGPGTVNQGASARNVLTEATRIGTQTLPAVTPIKQSKNSLLDAIKQAGGINRSASGTFSGEVNALSQAGLGKVTNAKNGVSVERMAEKMHEAGYLPDDDPATLIESLYGNPRQVFADDSAYRGMADRAMGDLPGAETVPKQVPWSHLQNLRSSINDSWNIAKTKGLNKEAAALADMKKTLDAAVKNTADGFGNPNDYMPAPVVAKWTEANKSYANLMDRFHKGPQSAIFRKGADGEPLAQGAQIAGKFWGKGTDAVKRVDGFRRLVEDNPAMLGQFKSMITTQGADTAKAGQELAGNFSKWAKQSLPGLRAAFSADEVKMMQNIAADIDRNTTSMAMANRAGGSDTYQNASNALDIGVLNNPTLGMVANKVPYGKALLESAKTSAEKTKARQLASLLANPEVAANALLNPRPQQTNALLQNAMPHLYRGAAPGLLGLSDR